MKILTVVGARPQFIKAATVSRAIDVTDTVEEVMVHTGQHFDSNMSQIFFDEMHIRRPDFNLDISSLPHGAMTGRMLENIENIILDENPDWVLVYGDTNSTLAGALAASKLNVQVAHVEAGLRSFNMQMPEEQNRILTDRLSNLLFCPTELAMSNLRNESFDNMPLEFKNVGDVMLDSALYYSNRANPPDWFDKMNLSDGFALATLHRAENTDNPTRLNSIIEALNEIHLSIPVILPLHPRTQKAVNDLGVNPKVNIVEPLGYLAMISLLKSCSFVLSDSGGLQKEAYFFEKCCLILRDETEWTELVVSGNNILVGTDKRSIIEAVDIVGEVNDFSASFFGDGSAAQQVVASLISAHKSST